MTISASRSTVAYENNMNASWRHFPNNEAFMCLAAMDAPGLCRYGYPVIGRELLTMPQISCKMSVMITRG